MKINGKVHCFFEQSGTFKNEFKKLGYEAEFPNDIGEPLRTCQLFGNRAKFHYTIGDR